MHSVERGFPFILAPMHVIRDRKYQSSFINQRRIWHLLLIRLLAMIFREICYEYIGRTIVNTTVLANSYG